MKKILLILSIALLHSSAFSQVFRLQENFNNATLPAGWINNAVTGTQTWSFGINGSATNAGNNNLDGTPMAFFDDDNLGAGNTNSTVRLTSPSFDNANDISSTLEFDYNFREFTGPADRFYVEVFNGSNWVQVFSTSSNDCGNWLGACAGNFPHANIDISAHKNANCQVRFTYHDGNDWCWYVGLDNISVSSAVNNDLEVAAIENPKNSCSLGAAETAQILIRNVGGNNISGPFSVAIDVDSGNQVVTETVNSTINSGDSLLYTFTGTINLSNKSVYLLKAYSSFSLDSINNNDTAAAIVENINPLNIPFIEDFESNSSSWIMSGQNNSWQIGIPNGIILDSAYRGRGSAVTNLIGNYNNSEQSYLEIACIRSSQPSRVPVLSFYLNYNSEPGFDEMIMESSIDNGVSWQQVNAGITSSNWYNNASSWNGLSNGWIKVETSLDSLVGQSNIKLRFVFTSDVSGNREGFAIDDFEVKYQNSTDVRMQALLKPTNNSAACGFRTEFIEVELQNSGTTAIDTTYLNYRINNGAVVTEILDSTLLPTQLISYQFTTSYSFSAVGNYSIDAWVSTRNDGNTANDSIRTYSLTNSAVPFLDTLPYFEDFESSMWMPGAPPNSFPLPTSWTSTGGLFQFYVSDNTSTTVTSGSAGDHTTGTGNFLQTFSDFPSNNVAFTSLESPCIQLSNASNIILEFWTHRFGINMGNLYLDIYDGNTWVMNVDSITTAPQAASTSPWSKHSMSIGRFSGKNIKLRYRAIKNVGNGGGNMAIDDIKISEAPAIDAQMNALISPSSDECIPSGTITVEIENYGTTALTSIPVSYTVDYINTVNDTLNTTLLPGSKTLFSFSQTYNFSPFNTPFNIETSVNLINDLNTSNDVLSSSYINTLKPINYLEDFESFVVGSCTGTFDANANDDLVDWTETSTQTYRWHIHDVDSCNGGTSSASTGPDTDHTNGNGIFLYTEATGSNGSALGVAMVETPCVDFRQQSAAEMSFWYHKFGADMSDLYIDVYDNNGWNLAIDSIIGSTHVSANASWLQQTTTLNQFAGQAVKIRFRATEPSGFRSDMAIDDVQFYNPLLTSISKNEASASITLYPNPNNGNFSLNVSNELVGKQYQVFDVKGGLVKQARINAPNSQIELSNAKKGVYFMRIEGMAKAERIVVL